MNKRLIIVGLLILALSVVGKLLFTALKHIKLMNFIRRP